MSVKYVWKVGQLQVVPSKNGLDNVVQSVDWSLSAVDGDLSVQTSVNTWLHDADASKFIEYQSLDEETVLSWVESVLGQTLIDSLRASLLVLLEEKKSLATKTVQPPWNLVTQVVAQPE